MEENGTVCIKCKHCIRVDGNLRDSGCLLGKVGELMRAVRCWVTGEWVPDESAPFGFVVGPNVYQFCRDLNTEGKCPDFEPE